MRLKLFADRIVSTAEKSDMHIRVLFMVIKANPWNFIRLPRRILFLSCMKSNAGAPGQQVGRLQATAQGPRLLLP